jgi:hypothetical protein
MLKNVTFAIVSVLFLVHLTGCIPVLAGAAAGGGTAAWISEKSTQEVNASFDKTVKAAESALNSLGLKITKETKKDDVAQIMSKYTDGKTIWVDIHRISDSISKIGVRVGAISDDEAQRKIMNKIMQYL